MGGACSAHGKYENTHKTFVVKSKGRELGALRRRWEDIIKLDRRERSQEGADCIRLAQDRAKWRAPVNTVMNFSDFIGH